MSDELNMDDYKRERMVSAVEEYEQILHCIHRRVRLSSEEATELARHIHLTMALDSLRCKLDNINSSVREPSMWKPSW